MRIFVIVLFLLAACSGPEPVTTTEGDAETASDITAQCQQTCADAPNTNSWAVVNGVECRCGSDYHTVERAGTAADNPRACLDTTGLYKELCDQEQEGVAIYRNFADIVGLGCDVGPLGRTLQQYQSLSYEGSVLHDGGRAAGEVSGIRSPSMLHFIGEAPPSNAHSSQLLTPNRRCDTTTGTTKPDDRWGGDGWCGRTEVYKPTFEGWRQHNQDGYPVTVGEITVSRGWDPWLKMAREFDSTGSNCDGIKSWCIDRGGCRSGS